MASESEEIKKDDSDKKIDWAVDPKDIDTKDVDTKDAELNDIEAESVRLTDADLEANRKVTNDDDEPVLNEWSKKEQENRQVQQLQDELYPKRTFVHNWFIMVSILAGVSAFLMGVGQFIGLFYQESGPVQSVVRVYMMAMCGLIVLNELEWLSFTRDSKLLWIWISRGIVYSFVGVIGIQEIEASEARSSVTEIWSAGLRKYLVLTAWAMIASGILYFVLGVTCMQIVLGRLRKKYAERIANAKESRRAKGMSSWRLRQFS
mmetsp:Transcript_39651/g.48279  ORF Transcript_39651/g.48279 Transcript_39651/m.48279 type:complete len:262 (+) Transcript_39651:160-945(+)|eukprot:CAMPEP_0172488246 /NCGR_PEP_ID=MMETSP1066-20121228/17688_1 /TAXON_ID=671091 /ORGANISM="Coscinodiscus wailesii, Strain CCMP2513" /LENGTH=261 /DNA_ID=CAMNT_0013255355 /DNA_START=187 /DNA_END=975 /DNA_ORIENTATION=+